MKCIHCLNEIEKKDKDHFFPKSWYPNTTPIKVQRWTIPSCIKCNREYGEIEEEMLIRIGLCVDPKNYASMGINSKAVRALDENSTEDENEKRIRKTKREKIIKELLRIKPEMTKGIIPNISGYNINAEREYGFFIPKDHIDKFIKKIIKGITFKSDKLYIDENKYDITISPKGTLTGPLKMLFDNGADYSKEPGLTIKRIIAKDAPINGIFFVKIWQQFLFMGSVIDKTKKKNRHSKEKSKTFK